MAVTTTSTQSIDLVRQFNSEVFNGRAYDRIDEFQTEDYVQHGPLTGMELHGSEESIETMRTFHAGFSDLEATQELAFSDESGAYVCTMFTYAGTHDGEFLGIPATDEETEVQGVVINRIEGNQIAEAWIGVDFLGLLHQLDLVPSLDELAA